MAFLFYNIYFYVTSQNVWVDGLVLWSDRLGVFELPRSQVGVALQSKTDSLLLYHILKFLHPPSADVTFLDTSL